MTKSAHARNAARAGVTTATLAENGYTADRRAIDGLQGFFELYNGFEQPEETPHVKQDKWSATEEGIDIKKYPCCHGTHTSINATEKNIQTHGIDSSEIEEVVVRATKKIERVVQEDIPETGLEAKFSVRYTVASAILHDRVGVHSFKDEAVKVDPRFDPYSMAATVEIRTTKGETFSKHVGSPPGRPENPLSDEEIYEKFEACTSGHLKPKPQTNCSKPYETSPLYPSYPTRKT